MLEPARESELVQANPAAGEEFSFLFLLEYSSFIMLC